MFSAPRGRKVLVTGATKGIGKGIAAVFAGAGADVVITGRNAEAGEEAVRDLTVSAGGKVRFVRQDVGVPEDCARAVHETIELLGGLDVVCANAGVFPERPLAEMTSVDLREIFAINVHGCIMTVRHAIPALEQSGRGRVVLTLVDHRARHGLHGLVALRRDEGRAARLHAHRGDRARPEGDHRQRRAPGQHPHRGARGDGP